jgi:hypothetical protein
LRRFGLIALAAVVTGLIVGIVIANAGGSGNATPSIPELKPPPGTIDSSGTTGTTGSTGATGTTGASTTPTQTQTTPSGSSGGSQTPQADTPQHNTTPPKGSPASRFEQFCKDNPGAC